MEQTIWIISTMSITVAIVIFAIIRIRHSISKNKQGIERKVQSSNNALRALAISLAVGGLIFGTDRLLAYSFFSGSILLSVFDIIKSKR